VISLTVLIVAEPFPGLDAERVAGALAHGLEGAERGLLVRAMSSPVNTDDLRASRAIVIAAARLDERTLAKSVAFELATSARQAGVPAYAVTGENALDPFDARMLDLQAILQASSARSLRSAGAKLARMV
jgi:glycerate 2-kinase